MESRRERPGFFIKIAILALLGVLLVIGILDTVSIVRARSRLNDAADSAAVAAVAAYASGHQVSAACDAAKTAIHAVEPDMGLGDHFCKVDTVAGTVQIKLRSLPGTILVGHVPLLRRLAVTNAKASADLGTP